MVARPSISDKAIYLQLLLTMLAMWRQRQQPRVITDVQEKIMRAKPRSAADVCLTDTECQRLVAPAHPLRRPHLQRLPLSSRRRKTGHLESQTHVGEPNCPMPCSSFTFDPSIFIQGIWRRSRLHDSPH